VLRPVAGSPFSLGANASTLDPRGVAVDPFGEFVYTSNFEDGSETSDVSAVSITPGVGPLTPVPGSPFTNGEGPGDDALAVVVDPLGRFLYVMNSGDISGYSINGSTGALSMPAGFPFESPAIPLSALALDPADPKCDAHHREFPFRICYRRNHWGTNPRSRFTFPAFRRGDTGDQS
jgi:hypothetical protein